MIHGGAMDDSVMSQNPLDDRPSSSHGTLLVQALQELLKALRLAHDVERRAWDFAVGIGSLRRLGLTESDLRWLVHKRYVEHARETTEEEQERRVFKHTHALRFKKRTCFVLTEAGVAYTDFLLNQQGRISTPVIPIGATKVDERPTPYWNRARHEVYVGEILVKRFKWPAQNQETVLDALEEENWPDMGIYDPLSPHAEKDPKQRLRDTIKCLNRYQEHAFLRFRGDGTGERVIWEFTRKAIEELKLEGRGHGHHVRAARRSS